MKNVSFITLIFVFYLLGVFSCSSKDDDLGLNCATNWATGLQNEISGISTAALAYGTDQSSQNCAALKSAYQSYINALEPYGDCAAITGQNRTDFNKALQEARDSIDTIC